MSCYFFKFTNKTEFTYTFFSVYRVVLIYRIFIDFYLFYTSVRIIIIIMSIVVSGRTDSYAVGKTRTARHCRYGGNAIFSRARSSHIRTVSGLASGAVQFHAQRDKGYCRAFVRRVCICKYSSFNAIETESSLLICRGQTHRIKNKNKLFVVPGTYTYTI